MMPNRHVQGKGNSMVPARRGSEDMHMAATEEEGSTKRPRSAGAGREMDANSRGSWRWKDPVQGMASSRHEFGEHGGVNMSIEASATFTVMEAETLGKLFDGELGADMDFYIYSRHFNPTVLNLSRQIAAMEAAEAAYCTSSGMAAIAGVLLQLCNHGDHIVASSRIYGGTHALLSHFLPRTSNITTTFLDLTGDENLLSQTIRAAFTPSTKVLYFEAISNPTLCVGDIPLLASIGHDMGATVVVDNTFSPLILSPLRLGADVVIHSVSKYISGGADIIAGAVCGPKSLIHSMMDLHQGSLLLLGPTMNPGVAFDIAERLPHLPLRIKEHCNRALFYAKRLKELGLRVTYPGLEEHPQHTLLKRMANPGFGFGGMLSLDVGSNEKANKLIQYLQNNVQFGLMAVSLGYYETLMSCPASSTSSELSCHQQQETGISPGLVRMSVGYSGTVEQRWSQLYEALSHLGLL